MARVEDKAAADVTLDVESRYIITIEAKLLNCESTFSVEHLEKAKLRTMRRTKL